MNSRENIQNNAGAQDADMFIAYTPQDETNLVACKIAHETTDRKSVV